MLRKLVIIALSAYFVLWHLLAYNLKEQIFLLIQHLDNDNRQFTYKNLEIAGFPFSWQIIIHEPKYSITNIDKLTTFSTKSVTLTQDYQHHSSVDLGKLWQIKITQLGLSEKEYQIIFDQHMLFEVDNRSYWQDFSSDTDHNYWQITLTNPLQTYVYNQDTAYYELDINYAKFYYDNARLDLQLGADFTDQITNRNSKMAMTIDVVGFYPAQSEQAGNSFTYEHKYVIRKFAVDYPNLKFNAQGTIELSKHADAQAEIELHLQQGKQLAALLPKAYLTKLLKLTNNKLDQLTYKIIVKDQNLQLIAI